MVKVKNIYRLQTGGIIPSNVTIRIFSVNNNIIEERKYKEIEHEPYDYLHTLLYANVRYLDYENNTIIKVYTNLKLIVTKELIDTDKDKKK